MGVFLAGRLFTRNRDCWRRRGGRVIKGGRSTVSNFVVTASDRSGGWTASRLAVWTKAYLRQALLADIATGFVTSTLALGVRFGGHITSEYAVLSLALPVMWAVALRLAGAYDPRFIGTGSDEFRKVINAGVGLTAALAILSYAVNTELSRFYLLLTMPGATVLGLVARYAKRKRLH